MVYSNHRKKWNEEDTLNVYNTPKNRYPELAKKLGRTLDAVLWVGRTKEEIIKSKGKIARMSGIVRPKASRTDRYMLKFFSKGKKPIM